MKPTLKESFKVLLIEDNPGDARLLGEFLHETDGSGFELTHCKLLSDGLARLEEGGIDIVLLDLFLPDSMGIATFNTVQQAHPNLPVIVMSGLDDESLAIKTVQEGAQDYLVKGQVDSRILPRAIRYAIERHQTEADLAKERDLLHTLVNNLPDYIYVKDQAGRYILDNIAHQRFLGASSDKEILGRTSKEFLPPDVASRIESQERILFESGSPLLNQEEVIVDSHGNQRWHITTKVPLRNPRGTIVGLVGIGRDVTERKEADQQIREANIQLAQSKEELIKVLADLRHSHEELKSAQVQLIEAEKMQSVGRLAAGVAHEVKNPLAILKMGTDYLSKNLQSPDENVALILADMSAALKRADSTIMGLLDFAAPHALDLKDTHLSQAIAHSLSFVRHELSGKSITVRKELEQNLPSVRLDSNKIQQAFVNILGNSIHAMAEHGTLHIRTYSKKLEPGEVDHDDGSRRAGRFRAGDTVVVAEVRDSGSGIESEKLEKIFDPFFTTKPTGKGTGLGLTVTKKIIELHGGNIEIKNRTEGGTLVTITFKA